MGYQSCPTAEDMGRLADLLQQIVRLPRAETSNKLYQIGVVGIVDTSEEEKNKNNYRNPVSKGPRSPKPARCSIVPFPAPVKSRQEDHPYSKLLQNCVAFIPLSCRDFTGTGDRSIEDRATNPPQKGFGPYSRTLGCLLLEET